MEMDGIESDYESIDARLLEAYPNHTGDVSGMVTLEGVEAVHPVYESREQYSVTIEYQSYKSLSYESLVNYFGKYDMAHITPEGIAEMARWDIAETLFGEEPDDNPLHVAVRYNSDEGSKVVHVGGI